MRPPRHPAGLLAQTVSFHRDPLDFLRRAQAQLGDVFLIRLLTARPVAVVAEPHAAAVLLAADYGAAHAGEARRSILPFASQRSVFGGDDGAHRAARKRIAPAFAAAAMGERREAMAEIATRRVAEWPRSRPFRLLERMREITDEIFVRLILGVRDDRMAGDLIRAVRDMLNTPGNPPLTLPGRGDGLVGELGERIFRRRQEPVKRALTRAVQARRAEGSPDVPDVLGGMIDSGEALADEEIVDELMSLLMAAQEPPAIALTWLLDRIAREPGLPGLFESDPEGFAVEAAISETLRLQPPASAALRRLTRPFEVASFTLPAGHDVMVPSSLLQRDSRSYERPDSFLPSRWSVLDPPQGSFFPFGGGDRRCVGEPLARAEFAALLPAILREVELRPIAEQPEPMVQRATVLVPKRSLLVSARSRV
jgi:cytochrome P450 family 135